MINFQHNPFNFNFNFTFKLPAQLRVEEIVVLEGIIVLSVGIESTELINVDSFNIIVASEPIDSALEVNEGVLSDKSNVVASENIDVASEFMDEVSKINDLGSEMKIVELVVVVAIVGIVAKLIIYKVLLKEIFY